jgi:hypothetical protein
MPGMSGAAGGDTAWWRDPRARWPAIVGLILVGSGLAHVAVWGVTGGPWEGPVTWRKPILFGISGGLTALSAGWVWSLLPQRRGDTLLAVAMAGTLFIEVLLIDLQAWRGVASHFNRSTPLDSFLYDAMGVLILFVSAVLLDLTVRLFLRGQAGDPAMLLAARSGMVLLVISCGLGIWVGVNGDLRAAAGLAPDSFGAAGVPKFPHGVAIHAIQWLPAIAWAARHAGLSGVASLRLVAMSAAGMTLLLGYALGQTLLGRPRFPPAATTVFLLGTAAVCLFVAHLIIAATAWGKFFRRRGLTGARNAS